MMPRAARRAALFVATGGYSGYAPIAPGTAGTLVAVPVFFVCAGLGVPAYLAVCCGLCVMAIIVSGSAERQFGRKDPPQVVIDEIAGYLITMATFPPDWRYAAAGFVLFRLMDIVKPYPANRINDRMDGGAGVVLDDVVAGIYANLLLQAVRWLAG
jgi:phosphatidylglycerophosphatase A